MSEYRHGSHSVFAIHLHLVWVTKYRKPVLVGDVALQARELLREIYCIKMAIRQNGMKKYSNESWSRRKILKNGLNKEFNE